MLLDENEPFFKRLQDRVVFSRGSTVSGEDSQPPGAMLVDLAKALCVSTDQLLGVKLVDGLLERHTLTNGRP